MIGKNGGQFLSSRTIPAAKQEKEPYLETSGPYNRIFRCLFVLYKE
jgi:hypothetical protein